MMEKDMDKLYGLVSVEFPDYKLNMGVSRTQFGDSASWYIELVGEPENCPCCHQKTKNGTITVWSAPSFESALEQIRELFREQKTPCKTEH